MNSKIDLDQYDNSLATWTPFVEVEVGSRKDVTIFENSRYRVLKKPEGASVHLSINALNWSTRHDWRDFQRIKNEICGEEHWAVELYPKESFLEDTKNVYHLYVFDCAMPSFAMGRRLVTERDFNPEARPEDCNFLPNSVIKRGS